MCRCTVPADSEGQASWPQRQCGVELSHSPCSGQDDLGLAAVEAELTREVPELLDAMNRSASEVNVLERQISEAQLGYQSRLKHWSSLYKELRSLSAAPSTASSRTSTA